jgi:hypothetical protein
LAVAAALELVLDDVLAAVVDDVLGAAALFVLLLPLPHPATTMAPSRQGRMNRIRTSCTCAPHLFCCPVQKTPRAAGSFRES